MVEKAPEVVEFLKNYETSSELTNKMLAYMQENDAEADETAKWFLQEYEDLWTKWLPEDIASKVKEAL
jgi:glycine betaine/proline transport system substrate-binding protein